MTGWWFEPWYTYPSEKYARQLGRWDDSSQLNGKMMKNVPNHQPEMINMMNWLKKKKPLIKHGEVP